jgi:hypothetical protein
MHPNSNTCISSEMIVKEFGGIENIAGKLYSNLKVSDKRLKHSSSVHIWFLLPTLINIFFDIK